MFKECILSATILGAIFFIPAASAQSQDPCSEITGAWKGTLMQTSSECTWDAVAQGAQYKEIYRLQFKLTHGRYPRGNCEDATFILSGSCKDAKLVLEGVGKPYNGTVFGGVLGANNGDVSITLEKSSPLNIDH